MITEFRKKARETRPHQESHAEGDPNQSEWLERVQRDHDNFRISLKRLTAGPAEITTIRPAISNLGELFMSQLRGHRYIKEQFSQEHSFADFFDLDHVMSRLHYADLTGHIKPSSNPS